MSGATTAHQGRDRGDRVDSALQIYVKQLLCLRQVLHASPNRRDHGHTRARDDAIDRRGCIEIKQEVPHPGSIANVERRISHDRPFFAGPGYCLLESFLVAPKKAEGCPRSSVLERERTTKAAASAGYDNVRHVSSRLPLAPFIRVDQPVSRSAHKCLLGVHGGCDGRSDGLEWREHGEIRLFHWLGQTSMTIANSSVGFASTKDFEVEPFVGGFRPGSRIQRNVLARGERKLLDALCAWLPDWVTPDQLTALGVFGAVVTAVGYAASNFNPDFLFLASLGVFINWFGDSLDGSLARYRETERHRYGFFVDNSMDAVSIVTICIGLGLSPYVGMAPALVCLVGYLLLGNYVFLSNHVTGAIRLSYLGCGPTELRLLIIGFNLALFVIGPLSLHVLGGVVSIHAMSVGVAGAVLCGIFLVSVFRTAAELKRQDRSRFDSPSSCRNSSTLSKNLDQSGATYPRRLA